MIDKQTTVRVMLATLITAATAGLVSIVGAAPAADGPTLAIRAETSGVDYERSAFGPAWKDTDHNGCGQRDDVLARDLTAVVKRGRCVVVAGRLVDPYTGAAVTFSKARANDVQIDHVVSLAEAWRSGAKNWTPAKRLLFATDQRNLVASKGSVNRLKSDKDPTKWEPIGAPRRCTYARRVVQVKVTYGLSADRAEVQVLQRYLRGCPR